MKVILEKSLFVEGGNLIPESVPIHQENVAATLDDIYERLVEGIFKLNPGEDTATLGSTGKKLPGGTSGDVDLAIDYNRLQEIWDLPDWNTKLIPEWVDLAKDAAEQLGMHFETKATVCSIGWPIVNTDGKQEGEVCQLDLMPTTNLKMMRFGRFSQREKEGKKFFKGKVRNVMLAIMASSSYHRDLTDETHIKVLDDGTEKEVHNEYEGWTYDGNTGLHLCHKKYEKFKANGNGHKKGDWKPHATVVDSPVISSDPDEIVEMIFGKGVTPEDVDTVQKMWKAWKNAPAVKKNPELIDKVRRHMEASAKHSDVAYPDFDSEEFATESEGGNLKRERMTTGYKDAVKQITSGKLVTFTSSTGHEYKITPYGGEGKFQWRLEEIGEDGKVKGGLSRNWTSWEDSDLKRWSKDLVVYSDAGLEEEIATEAEMKPEKKSYKDMEPEERHAHNAKQADDHIAQLNDEQMEKLRDRCEQLRIEWGDKDEVDDPIQAVRDFMSGSAFLRMLRATVPLKEPAQRDMGANTFVDKFFELPFDLEAYVGKAAKIKGISYRDALHEYNEDLRSKTGVGARAHNIADDAIKGKPPRFKGDNVKEIAVFSAIYDYAKQMVDGADYAESEVGLHAKDVTVGGRFDLMFHKDGVWTLVDWKVYDSDLEDVPTGKVGLDELTKNLNNNSYNKYALQLNVYEWAARNQGLIPEGDKCKRQLHQFKFDDGDNVLTIKVIDVPDMQELVSKMVERGLELGVIKRK